MWLSRSFHFKYTKPKSVRSYFQRVQLQAQATVTVGRLFMATDSIIYKDSEVHVNPLALIFVLIGALGTLSNPNRKASGSLGPVGEPAGLASKLVIISLSGMGLKTFMVYC